MSLSAETNGVSRVKRLEAKIRDPSNERRKGEGHLCPVYKDTRRSWRFIKWRGVIVRNEGHNREIEIEIETKTS